jgi:hypothetical protein
MEAFVAFARSFSDLRADQGGADRPMYRGEVNGAANQERAKGDSSGPGPRQERKGANPVEFACCGDCDYLIKVYEGEDGSTKPCPRCGWNRHNMGGSWNWRALANGR